MKTIALCSALAFGALTSAALAETADQSGHLELTNEQLDKITAGNNANPFPGSGTVTAESTYNYFNHSGYPGDPQNSNNDGASGTQNARNRSDQNVGSGRGTH